MGSKTPHKKPRNGKFNPEQKRENRSLAQVRIKVEHIIRFLKIFRILSSRYTELTPDPLKVAFQTPISGALGL